MVLIRCVFLVFFFFLPCPLSPCPLHSIPPAGPSRFFFFRHPQVLPFQAPRVATSSSTTCRRSSAMRSSPRCSCHSETWSAPRSTLTERQIRANALVSMNLGVALAAQCYDSLLKHNLPVALLYVYYYIPSKCTVSRCLFWSLRTTEVVTNSVWI